ncbi:MAG: tyrosine-type recombinase/integrase [Deltaproteobacteria bacterium]|nr:tyrosine-type recombinase/integrase [Deltaproteobacteria bacterium]
MDISYRDENGKWKKFTRTIGKMTKKQALQIERRMRQEFKAQRILGTGPGTTPSAGNQSYAAPAKKAAFSGFAKTWFETYVRPNNKPSARANKRGHIKLHLVPYFKDSELASITAEQIEQFVALKLTQGLNKKTVNNIVGTLRTMLAKAEDWEYLERSPMRRIKPLKTDAPRPRFYTSEETARILEACRAKESAWYGFFLCAFTTGLRLGELCALQWRDVDFQAGKLIIQRSLWHGIEGTPKSHRIREVPLHPRLETTLKALEKEKTTKYVFSKNGKPLTRNSCRKPFARICAAAGVEELRLHDIRHSFASQLVINGKSIKAVQELLGHSDIQTTMIYAHLSPSVHQDAVNSLLTVEEPKISDKLESNQQNQHDFKRPKIEKSQQDQHLTGLVQVRG